MTHCTLMMLYGHAGDHTHTHTHSHTHTHTHTDVVPHLSDSRKGQMSGTGGVGERSLANAMMCSKVMSVCVHTSATPTSCLSPWRRGVRRSTCTTMGSLLMASTTASSDPAFEKSRPFTWRGGEGVGGWLIIIIIIIIPPRGK